MYMMSCVLDRYRGCVLKGFAVLLLKCPRRKKTLTEDEMWEMEDKLAALNKELEESLQRS